MPIVPCPECGTDVNVPAGRRARCGECGARVSEYDDAPMVEAVDADESPEKRPRRAATKLGAREPCPKCGSRWIRSGPWPWYLGTVGALICKAVVCQECGHEYDLYKPKADLAKRKLWLAIGINAVGLTGIIIVITLLILWIRFTTNN